jgi:hypothetical protein
MSGGYHSRMDSAIACVRRSRASGTNAARYAANMKSAVKKVSKRWVR